MVVMMNVRHIALFLCLALTAASCVSATEGAEATAVSAIGESVDEVSESETALADGAAALEGAEETVDGVAEEADPDDLATEPVTATTVHETTSDEFPDIIAAQATPTGGGTWRFDVTVSSTYDSPDRYADAWRVVGPDGTEYGIRVLTHDHASEQPFTRSQSGIEIPADVLTVTVEGRDLANGWGGGTLQLNLSE